MIAVDFDTHDESCHLFPLTFISHTQHTRTPHTHTHTHMQAEKGGGKDKDGKKPKKKKDPNAPKRYTFVALLLASIYLPILCLASC